MFILSVRLSPKRMLIAALVAVFAVSAGVTLSKYLGSKEDVVKPAIERVEEKKEASQSSGSKTQKEAAKTTQKKADVKKTAAKTNDQRLAFIQSFGWETESEPAEVMEVIIPKEFDDVYKSYNSIQKMQGLDLSSLAGKRCKRYSYTVLNYPGQKENVRINLLVEKNKIVGGDVCSTVAGGFMHGFAME